jgi:hypothetical protein
VVIPVEEIRLVATVIGEAYELAAGGSSEAGWRRLQEGARRAGAAAERGEPWAADLRVIYRELADCYAEIYGRPA